MQTRVLAGHQPNLLPWIGYFEKANLCDVFVFADDVQFAKQTFTNRVKVSLGGREQFFSLPVQGSHTETIREKSLALDSAAVARALGILSQIANESRNRRDVMELVDKFEQVLGVSSYLGELNISLIRFLLSKFQIRTETVISSELEIGDARSTDRIAQRCLACGANCYLAGQGSDYINPERLAKSGISMQIIEYQTPSKLNGSRSHLSIISALGDFGWNQLSDLFQQNRLGSRLS